MHLKSGRESYDWQIGPYRNFFVVIFILVLSLCQVAVGEDGLSVAAWHEFYSLRKGIYMVLCGGVGVNRDGISAVAFYIGGSVRSYDGNALSVGADDATGII